DQRVPQDGAGLAHGRAPRQPRHGQRNPGSVRNAAGPALNAGGWNYRAPWWLPGGNLQTIWPALYARRGFGPRPAYRRERWTAPDGDFVDLDWLAEPAPAPGGSLRPQPLLVLFHGLE